LSGGASVELMARTGNPRAYDLIKVMPHFRHCNFSFSGIRTHVHNLILKEQKQLGMKLTVSRLSCGITEFEGELRNLGGGG